MPFENPICDSLTSGRLLMRFFAPPRGEPRKRTFICFYGLLKQSSFKFITISTVRRLRTLTNGWKLLNFFQKWSIKASNRNLPHCIPLETNSINFHSRGLYSMPLPSPLSRQEARHRYFLYAVFANTSFAISTLSRLKNSLAFLFMTHPLVSTALMWHSSNERVSCFGSVRRA